jgi:hypothetical protein
VFRNNIGAPLSIAARVSGHFSGTSGVSPALPYSRWPSNFGYPKSLLDACTWRNGMCGVETTRANFSAGMSWNRSDLFFLSDALARGMSIRDLAGFLNRTEDEVRQQARWRRHDSISSCEGSPSERHRRSTETKSAFSDESTVFLAKRRASAARLRH